MQRYSIRTYFEAQLLEMLARGNSAYTDAELKAELARRAEIKILARDTLKYPELSPSFH